MADSSSRMIIRVDASPQIGMGHLMRCLTIADEWVESGGDVIIITDNEEMVRKIGNRQGISCLTIRTSGGSAEDARVTGTLIREKKPFCLVVDGCQFSSEYLEEIRNENTLTIVIDDEALREWYPCDVIVNPGPDTDEIIYPCENNTLLLLGHRYALLRREYADAVKNRNIQGPASRILVTMGGSDPDNVTVKILSLLENLNIPTQQVRVILGTYYDHEKELHQSIASSRHRVSLFRDVDNMAEHMAWADAAFASGGTTALELTCMGIPSFFVNLADNQLRNTSFLHRVKAGICLGWPSELLNPENRKSCDAVLTSVPDMSALHQRSVALIDGQGAPRLVEILRTRAAVPPDLTPFLRLTNKEDCIPLWRLACDSGVRANSFRPESIPLQNHKNWFNEKLQSSDTRIFVFDFGGAVAAQLRYDKCDDVAEIDLSVSPFFRGLGLSVSLLKLTVEPAKDQLGIKRIRAFVVEGNTASCRMLLTAGFVNVGMKEIKGRQCLIFEH